MAPLLSARSWAAEVSLRNGTVVRLRAGTDPAWAQAIIQQKYGHPVAVLETFVEQGRFRGTIYRAANWRRVGQTKGRTRQDRRHRTQAPVKEGYLYPLQSHFREVLCV